MANHNSELSTTLRTIIDSNDLPAFTQLLQTHDKTLVASAQDDDGRNFLHWLAEKGRVHLITHSLTLGFDPDPLDEDDWTPLHLAVATGHDQTVIALLKGGCRIDSVTGGAGQNSALHIGAGKGFSRVCTALLTSIKDACGPAQLTKMLEQCNGQGFTPLQRAVCGDKVEAAKVLIDFGANPDIRERHTGETLLHIASGNKNPEMVRLLIESRPSLVNEKDNRGFRPYYCNDDAVIEVYREYVDLIEDEGEGQLGRFRE